MAVVNGGRPDVFDVEAAVERLHYAAGEVLNGATARQEVTKQYLMQGTTPPKKIRQGARKAELRRRGLR